LFAGLPHSSYSKVVSGIEASSIVVTTSTKGTCAMMTLYPGAMFATAHQQAARPPIAGDGRARRASRHDSG
jgi:hypothetical protein